MDLGIAGKVALITGGAHGIGNGIVAELVREGAEVFFTSRDTVYTSLKATPIRCDLSTLDALAELLPRVDILVNNAGHTMGVTNPYCSREQWHAVMRLNFEVAVELANAVIPGMKRRKWGRIVNITSCAGLENSGPVTFSVAKAALTAYTRSMGRVLAIEEPGIVMSAVYPGVIDTLGGHWQMADSEHRAHYLRERVPTGRFQTIEEFAPVVAFYCSQHAAACHGSIIGADQGQSRHYSAHVYL